MSKIPISLDEDFERDLQNLKRNHSYTYMKICGLQPKQLDFAGYIADFCEANNQADNSIDGTSNSASKDIVALENDISKPIFKLIAYNKIYVKLSEKYGDNTASDWLESEYLGRSYLHDAHSSTFIPYCYAYDLSRLAKEGLFFLSRHGGIPYNSKPASHLDTFVNHVKEYVSFCCNRQAGAVGLPNLLPWMYYFWLKDIKEGYNGCRYLKDNKLGIETFGKYDNKNQNIKYFKQCTQSLIYALNQPYLRNSIQSAFTNVSIFDHYYAHSLFDGMIYPDDSLAFDNIDNIVNLQVVFCDTISEIREENMFTFPVLTFSLLIEGEKEDTKFRDEIFAKWASDHNTKWFDFNFYISKEVTALSNCCRLSSNIKEMMNDQGYFNSVGGSGLSVGSIKVNTVNLANIAYQSISETKTETSSGDIIKNFFTKVEKTYLDKLKKQVRLNLMCLDVIRDILIDNKNKRQLLPNIADGLIDMKHMYNTIGVIGIYETLKAFQNKLDTFKISFGLSSSEKYDYITFDSFGNIFYTANAENFIKCLFKTMHSEFFAFKKEQKLNYSINCEQIPAETAAKKLMSKDELSYPDLVVTDLPLYGNQFIPLGIKTTLEERVRVAALFDSYLNGGSIAHLNFESTLNKDQAWYYLNWIAKQGLTYSALTTKISACEDNHGFFGNTCPICGKPAVTTYARIVGFYTATGITPDGKETSYGSWSTARKEEFKLREWEN